MSFSTKESESWLNAISMKISPRIMSEKNCLSAHTLHKWTTNLWTFIYTNEWFLLKEKTILLSVSKVYSKEQPCIHIPVVFSNDAWFYLSFIIKAFIKESGLQRTIHLMFCMLPLNGVYIDRICSHGHIAKTYQDNIQQFIAIYKIDNPDLRF